MKVLVSGGGTGGHIYPALTIVEAIREIEPNAEFLYVGTETGLEADIAPREGIPFEKMDLAGFERKISFENVTRAFKACKGLLKAKRIVDEFKPSVAVGTGGYVCGPVLFVASLMGTPSMIQEQNAVAGITNKILSKVVTKVALGTEAALSSFPKDKCVYTGNPIRRSVMEGDKTKALKEFGFKEDLPILLITGGSRGARSINNAVLELIKKQAADKQVQILHVTGTLGYESVLESVKDAGVDLEKSPNIKVVSYLYNMPMALSMADLLIMQAGAIALAEVAAVEKPAVLVPYPYATGNHQEANARAFVEKGAARMILDRDLTGEILIKEVEEIIFDADKRKSMAAAMRGLGKPEAAAMIAKIAVEIANK
ncbi:MAG: undecaprenyldiphospho-muramoylpentapeptide beta-N-acetylglucosaminyltransferase [Selenomonadaceae bacterium]|nr:undecaprenyldiphospho-muramoylpentapeptide beta-N-acetylglucosaminyltransferase [Selenomonadaceae bacterium]